MVFAPTTNITYKTPLDGTKFKDGTTLNTYLVTNFYSSNLIRSFSNVNISYKENSSSFSYKTYDVIVTPIQNAKWEDGTNNATDLKVSFVVNGTYDDNPSPTPDSPTSKIAAYPISDTYIAQIGGTSTNIKDNESLNNYLKSKFNNSDLSSSSDFNSSFGNAAQYQNVEVKFVDSSADFAKKNLLFLFLLKMVINDRMDRKI